MGKREGILPVLESEEEDEGLMVLREALRYTSSTGTGLPEPSRTSLDLW